MRSDRTPDPSPSIRIRRLQLTPFIFLTSLLCFALPSSETECILR